jgi:hypothetical protein
MTDLTGVLPEHNKVSEQIARFAARLAELRRHL